MFYKVLPFYLTIGMTYDQFWYGDPYIAKAYREAQELRLEAQNQQLWLQGMYIYNAFAVVLANSFSKNSKSEYPKEPYTLFPEKHKKEEVMRQRKEIVNNLERFKRLFDKGKEK